MNINLNNKLYKFINFTTTIIKYWSLVGGFLLFIIVFMSVISIVSDFLFKRPFPGDVELVQMGCSIAIFTFLPYCQISNAHVTADIFTSNISKHSLRFLENISAFIGMCISGILFGCMWHGLFDYIKYKEVTTVLQIPHYISFFPILVSLALSVIAAFIILLRNIKLIGAP